MPLYEYRCRACSSKVELLVGTGTSTKSLACTECGAKQLDKLLSTFAAHGGSAGTAASVGDPCGAPGCPRERGFT